MGTGYAGYASVFNRKIATIGQLTIRYLEGGYGIPLLYVHGLEGWGSWDSVHITFALSNHVYAPLLPGWQDGRIPSFIKSPADYAKLMRDFLEVAGIKTATLVGYSIGGWIALYLAAEFPDLVERLVIVDSLGLCVGDARPAAVGKMDQEAFGEAVFARRGPVLVPHDFNPDFGGVFEDLRNSPDFKRYWRGKEILVNWIGANLEDSELGQVARRIKAKTLIVWGRQDGLAPCEHGGFLADCIPQATLVLLADAGHTPMKDKRETFQGFVHQFLSNSDAFGPDRIVEA